MFAAASGGVNADRLAAMDWVDIAPTEQTALRHGLSADVLKVSATVESHPCRYLRGMLELANSRPAEALAEWEKIPLSEIPVDALYAPWRVASGADGNNRYAGPLSEAVGSGKTSPLVAARWHALGGNYLPALDAYLKSDPAQSTPHEADQFRIMKLHTPVAADVDRLIAGDLRGKRLPEALKEDLARVIKEAPAPDKQRIAELLKTDPDFAAAATQAAARQLEIRQLFAANRFSEVVEKTRGIGLAAASTETVFLAFLAASKTGENETADRWAEELLRRKPGTETETWITDIRANSR